MQHFITQLSHAFPIKDLGALHYFLGVDVHCTSFSLYFSQYKYVIDLLWKTKMLLAKPVSSPMVASLRLLTYVCPLFNDPTIYHNIVDSLQYLSFTCPYVSFVVNKACQFMYSLRESYRHTVKRIL